MWWTKVGFNLVMRYFLPLPKIQRIHSPLTSFFFHFLFVQKEASTTKSFELGERTTNTTEKSCP